MPRIVRIHVVVMIVYRLLCCFSPPCHPLCVGGGCRAQEYLDCSLSDAGCAVAVDCADDSGEGCLACQAGRFQQRVFAKVGSSAFANMYLELNHRPVP